MTAALMEVPAPLGPARVVTSDELTLIKTTVAAGATDAELKLFLFDCQRQGVHPLDRLLHFTKRGGKYTPITSIDFMRIRAADTGEYAGSDDAVFRLDEEGVPWEATVTVYRLTQGQRFPYTATARWDEYKPEQNDFLWRKMPHTMLGKCAEALALRKGFPRQLAGLYAREELDQADHTTVTEQVTPAEDPAAAWLVKIAEANTVEALETVGRELRAAKMTISALLLKTLRASYEARLAALKTARDQGQEG
jgi:phage recombination protein Bet